ncbi:uncharacterized protein LOC113209407 isoform X1 [Frankliniella occidentalis]|uniref:Uncharacterized protein LOC113209407 isoform X1 n=1 Tax=Frankliniella occidentalis TaxID=133901 RepID=A0A6J1SN16_FRAOC|nr:uncharacterized protein LOC113209407 isoform X1 [Frankliniella occidentalis]
MFQTYIFLVLSLCAAARGFDYTDGQYREIDNRLTDCLKNVPETYNSGVLNAPGTDCRYSAGLYKVNEGVEKEALTNLIIECLAEREVDADSMDTARQCLEKSLAIDLPTDTIDQNRYSPNEIAELNDRMAACVDSVEADDVTFAFTTAGNDCRYMAGEYNLDQGVPKENLTDLIAQCLRTQGVSEEKVTAATHCLRESLAKDLGMDKLPYSDYQIAVIDVRMVKCLDAVTDTSKAGYLASPGTACRYFGLEQLRAGVQRRDLANMVVACLSGQGTAPDAVSAAQQCLGWSLSKDLDEELVEEKLYTDDQIDELEVRLAECLDVVPGNFHSCSGGERYCWNVPGDICRTEAGDKLYNGFAKEALTDEIVGCLDSQEVMPVDVFTARECLRASLAKDFSAVNSYQN